MGDEKKLDHKEKNIAPPSHINCSTPKGYFESGSLYHFCVSIT